MKNILITGAYGFVGTNLAGHLAKSHKLFALDIKRSGNPDYAAFYSWDGLDTIPWDEIDTIIHLAGKAHDTSDRRAEKEYFDANLETAKKVFDRFLASGAKKFVFFSSVKAAADSVGTDALTEEATPDPRGAYGASKLAAEKYIRERSGSRAGGEGDKRVYILRPCMICGPGAKGNLRSLYTMVSMGVPYPLGAFENRRSFTSIDNLCFIMDNLIQKDIPSGVYNVADDEAVSTNELVALILKVSGRKGTAWKWDKGFVARCAKIGDALHLPFNSVRLRKLTENYIVSNLKLKKALGIGKMPVDAKDGLEKAIRALRGRKQ